MGPMTLSKTSAHMMSKSHMSRPATDGNKKVTTSARRMGAKDQIAMGPSRAPLKGPDKGDGAG